MEPEAHVNDGGSGHDARERSPSPATAAPPPHLDPQPGPSGLHLTAVTYGSPGRCAASSTIRIPDM